MNFSFVPLFLVTLIFFGRYQQQQLDYNFGGRLIADAANRFVAIHSLRGKTRLASGYHYTDHRRIESAGFRQIQIPPLSEFLNFKMIAAVLIGIFVAWLAGRGVPLMSEQPVLVTGLLIGTVIGVAFVGGIPVGPLIAAGLLSFVAGKV